MTARQEAGILEEVCLQHFGSAFQLFRWISTGSTPGREQYQEQYQAQYQEQIPCCKVFEKLFGKSEFFRIFYFLICLLLLI